MAETRCYSVKDIQQILGVSRAVVYELIKKKEFRGIFVGGKYCISKRSFDQWLDGDIDEPEGSSCQ